MNTETALTAFCLTTVLLIVGLVVLTASQLNLASPEIVGNYLGIPTLGRISRESVPLTIPEVNARDPLCYQNGLQGCKRANAGQNFGACAQQVALECGLTYTQAAGCVLPDGFELKYLSKRECDYGVIDECNALCAIGFQKECVQSSKGRCALIGGKFQGVYLQTKYAALER